MIRHKRIAKLDILLVILPGAALCMLAAGGCSDDPGDGAADADTDTDTDADADTDTDTDTDTDADTDADTDTDTDADADTDTQTPEECIIENCMTEVGACMADEVCSGWMSCIQACGDDAMACPTFCGLYYPSTLATGFTECAVDAECLEIDFSGFDPCEVPQQDLLDLSDMAGTWWFAAGSGEEHLFDYGCQKLVFEEVSATQLDVSYSVPLTDNDVEKICETVGTFTHLSDGSVEVVYENWAAYHETWYIIHRSANAMLVHVCFASEADSRDYGTLVLTRVPLGDLETAEHGDLEAAVEDYTGNGLDGLEPAAQVGCINE